MSLIEGVVRALEACLDSGSFDPSVHVDVEDFTDIIGRNFRTLKEGLRYDNSPASHMWRTIIAPTRFL